MLLRLLMALIAAASRGHLWRETRREQGDRARGSYCWLQPGRKASERGERGVAAVVVAFMCMLSNILGYLPGNPHMLGFFPPEISVFSKSSRLSGVDPHSQRALVSPCRAQWSCPLSRPWLLCVVSQVPGPSRSTWSLGAVSEG